MRFVNPSESMYAGRVPSISSMCPVCGNSQCCEPGRCVISEAGLPSCVLPPGIPGAEHTSWGQRSGNPVPMGYAGSNAPAWPPAPLTAQQALIMESGAVTAAAAEHCTPGSGCPVSVNDITVFAWLKIPAYAAAGVPTAQPTGSGWAQWHAAWKRMHDLAVAAVASYGGTQGYAALAAQGRQRPPARFGVTIRNPGEVPATAWWTIYGPFKKDYLPTHPLPPCTTSPPPCSGPSAQVSPRRVVGFKPPSANPALRTAAARIPSGAGSYGAVQGGVNYDCCTPLGCKSPKVCRRYVHEGQEYCWCQDPQIASHGGASPSRGARGPGQYQVTFSASPACPPCPAGYTCVCKDHPEGGITCRCVKVDALGTPIPGTGIPTGNPAFRTSAARVPSGAGFVRHDVAGPLFQQTVKIPTIYSALHDACASAGGKNIGGICCIGEKCWAS